MHHWEGRENNGWMGSYCSLCTMFLFDPTIMTSHAAVEELPQVVVNFSGVYGSPVMFSGGPKLPVTYKYVHTKYQYMSMMVGMRGLGILDDLGYFPRSLLALVGGARETSRRR